MGGSLSVRPAEQPAEPGADAPGRHGRHHRAPRSAAREGDHECVGVRLGGDRHPDRGRRLSSGASIALGSLANAGTMRTSLPYGTWTIRRNGRTTNVTLSPSTVAPTEATIPQASL